MALRMSSSFHQNYVCDVALNTLLALILLHFVYTAMKAFTRSLSLSLSLSFFATLVSDVVSRIAAEIHVPQTGCVCVPD